MKKQSGITLIALIVTAIVLLILAGVSLSTIVGNNGVLHQASTSVEKTREAKAKEDVLVAWDSVDSDYWDAWTENSNVKKKDYFTEANLNSYLEGKGVVSNLVYNENGVSTLTYTDAETNKSYDISIDTNGNITSVVKIETNYLLVSDVKNQVLSETENTVVVDEYGNEIIVPPGFMIRVDDTTNNADSAIEGIVIEDCTESTTNGNQFVWIPVGKVYYSAAEYKVIRLARYSFNGSVATVTQPTNLSSYRAEVVISDGGCNYTEYQPTSESISVKARNINEFYENTTKNGGYYIGRYEVGKENDIVVCKSGLNAYEIQESSEALSLSQQMYGEETAFNSDLVNSYAWDTAIVFIQNFGTNANASSYASLYIGSNDEYCNINNLSSNCCEWSTEIYDNAELESSIRGGYLNTMSYNSKGVASTRTNNSSDSTIGQLTQPTFRPILYLEPTIDCSNEGIETVQVTGWAQEGEYFKKMEADGTITQVKLWDYVDHADTTWRVMGINNNKELELVSNLPTEAVTASYPTEFSTRCNNLYGNEELGITARNVSLEDLDKTNSSDTTYQNLMYNKDITYWLNDPYYEPYADASARFEGQYGVANGGVGYRTFYHTWMGGGSSYEDYLRPIITISNSTKVITNENENSASNMWTLSK